MSQPKYDPDDNRWSKESTVGNRREPVGTCWVVANNFNESQEYSPCRTSEFLFKIFYQSVIKVAHFLSNIDTFGELKKKKKLTSIFIHDCIVFNVKYFGECRIKIPLKETKSIKRNKIRNKTLLSTRVSTKTLYTHVILVSVIQRK